MKTDTKNGISAAKEIELKDSFENKGAQMVKKIMSKTSDTTGVGMTSHEELVQFIYREGIKAVAAGLNPMEIKKGIYKAIKIVDKETEQAKKPAAGVTLLRTISKLENLKTENEDQNAGVRIVKRALCF